MASGTITLTKSGSGELYGQILWSSVSNGTAANTSTVTATIQLKRPAGWYTQGTWKGSLKVGGTTKNISYHTTVRDSWVTIDTLTTTVSHNADGSGTCYLYGLINGPSETSMYGTSVSGSATITLDPIARYASITSASNFKDADGNPTIIYSNPAGNSVTSLQACISLDGTTAKIGYKDVPKTAASYAFPLTETERNTLRAATPNSNTLKVYVLLKTVIGSGSDVKSATATMSIVDANPVLSPTVVDTNSTTTNITGNNRTLIPGHSLVQATFNATAQKYATITAKRLEHGNQILTGDGKLSVTNHPFRFIVTDSRGNKTIKDTNDTNNIVPYFNPTCAIGNNMPATDGTFSLVVTGLFYNGAIGKTTNTLTVQYRRKTAGGSYGSWTTIGSVTKSGNNYTATARLTGLDYQTAYTFQAKVIDALNTDGVTSVAKTVISQPVFDWGEKDFQFNVPVNLKNGCDIQKNGAIAYAPNGFGLGGTGVWVSDLNNAKDNGFYSWTSDASNIPFGYGNLLALNRGDSRVTQIAIDPQMSLCGEMAVRHCTNITNNTWTAWEYINPGMSLGVEYKTVEKRNGAGVYTKLIDFGALPNSASKNVSTGVNASKIVRAEIMATNGTNNIQLPYFLADGTLCAKHLFNSTNVQITTANDYTAYTAQVQIWYTKD